MKTVNVKVEIQLDINSTDILRGVIDALDMVNITLNAQGMEEAPQIFVSEVQYSDITIQVWLLTFLLTNNQ